MLERDAAISAPEFERQRLSYDVQKQTRWGDPSIPGQV